MPHLRAYSHHVNPLPICWLHGKMLGQLTTKKKEKKVVVWFCWGSRVVLITAHEPWARLLPCTYNCVQQEQDVYGTASRKKHANREEKIRNHHWLTRCDVKSQYIFWLAVNKMKACVTWPFLSTSSWSLPSDFFSWKNQFSEAAKLSAFYCFNQANLNWKTSPNQHLQFASGLRFNKWHPSAPKSLSQQNSTKLPQGDHDT